MGCIGFIRSQNLILRPTYPQAKIIGQKITILHSIVSFEGGGWR
jgi:hypothetical protein